MNSRVRIFTNHTRDKFFTKFFSLEAGYLLSLLVDKCGKKITDFKITTIYPFEKIFNNLLEMIELYPEDIFIFYLENFFHSNEYYINYLKLILNKFKKLGITEKTFVVQSFKLSKQEAIDIMNEYPFVKVCVLTDMEYFFNELLYNSKSLCDIQNIIYKNDKNETIDSGEKPVLSDLKDYILGGYYNGYLEMLQDNHLYRTLFMDDDRKSTFYATLKRKQAILSTGKGCLYNCTYCFRGVKYSKVRQIPLEIIKKDLDYLSSNGYKSIYLYDDCFLTTNYSRLDQILELLNSYDLNYYTAIRYEMAFKDDVLMKLLNSKIDRLQIGVQTISEETNKIVGRNFDVDRFKKVFGMFKENGKNISLDLILGLPGDNLKDFITTLHFALDLKPESIFINTLFLNPNTYLYNHKEESGIVFTHESNTNPYRYLHSVPLIKYSKTFTEKDVELAKKYIDKVIQLNQDIHIISR